MDDVHGGRMIDIVHDSDCDGFQLVHHPDPVSEPGADGRTMWRPACRCGWQARYLLTDRRSAERSLFVFAHPECPPHPPCETWVACDGRCVTTAG